MLKEALTLLELNKSIQSIIKEHTIEQWVIAEIGEIKTNYSGHCYLELIQKSDGAEQIIAKSRATIWASTFRMIKPYFESVTKRPLEAGISIMVKAKVEFHELYGLSLNISDIEPSYTVGEMALQKLQVIERLKTEGVFDMNQDLPMSEVPKNIAVISSESAAGYLDFIDQIRNNPHGYKYHIKLFPAIMQGKGAEDSIIIALDKINLHERYFDAVVMIRGGGSQADLSCFDQYWLAFNMAQFPIPIITGIGHEQDEHVADMVANTKLKTPTAVAEYLLQKFDDAHEKLLFFTDRLKDNALGTIESEKQRISKNISGFTQLVKVKLRAENKFLGKKIQETSHYGQKNLYKRALSLDQISQALKSQSKSALISNKRSIEDKTSSIKKVTSYFIGQHIDQLESQKKKVEYLDPSHVLKRGFTMTSQNGKIVTKARAIEKGEMITTFYDGEIISNVKKQKNGE